MTEARSDGGNGSTLLGSTPVEDALPPADPAARAEGADAAEETVQPAADAAEGADAAGTDPAEESRPAGMTEPVPPVDPAASPEAPRRSRKNRRDAGLNGVLVVDKPVGPTSHDVVALVRRLAGTRRIGHGGTLDPFASGVLPLYLGVATRLAEYHLGATKAYRATVCFGAASTTDDLEGELTPVDGPPASREAVESALAGLVGTHDQRPPGFSARRIGGRRAYALARRGEAPVLPARSVTFHALALTAWDDEDPSRPLAEVEVVCSAGTYVRALARDVGLAVGSAAYLGALRRTASGPFGLADARPIESLREAAADGRLPGLMLPVGVGLDDLPAVVLRPDELRAVAHGGWIGAAARVPLPVTDRAGGSGGEGSATPVSLPSAVRLLAPDGSLAAIGRLVGSKLVPDKVLVDRSGPAVTAEQP